MKHPPRRLRRADGSALAPRVAHYLLFGPMNFPPAVEGEDPFEIFDLTKTTLEALWRQHRAALLERWRTCGDEAFPWAAQRFEHQPGTWTSPSPEIATTLSLDDDATPDETIN